MTRTPIQQTSPGLIRSGRAIGNFSAWAVIAIAAAGIAGWITDNHRLTSIHPGLVPINPLTALCFLAGAGSMVLIHRKGAGLSAARPLRRLSGRLALGMAGAVAAIGFLRLLGYFPVLDFTLDQVLFREKLLTVPFGPNRMAPNTAFGFLLCGAAAGFASGSGSRSRNLSQGLGITLFAFAFLGLLGYLLRSASLYQITRHIPMSLPTLLCFLLSSIGLLFLHPRTGPVSLAFSSTTGGYMIRRLLPVVILTPAGAAWLLLRLDSFGDPGFVTGIARLTLANVLIASVAVYAASTHLHRADMERLVADGEVRRLNASLQVQADRLAEANKGLEAFSYSVSHDLRSPLRHIQGYVSMLEGGLAGKLDEKLARYLEAMKEAAARMNALIENLLEFARLGRAEIRVKPVDMEALARECIRRLAPETEGRNVVWDLGALPAAEADPSLMEQVLINLLSNAIKYSRSRPEIRVEIGFQTRPDGEGAYYVKDNGIGFDMRYADKLFGVFQRLHKASEYEGTGIGLANVKSIVQRHGGKVWAESEPGRGAVFRFSLRLPAHGA